MIQFYQRPNFFLTSFREIKYPVNCTVKSRRLPCETFLTLFAYENKHITRSTTWHQKRIPRLNNILRYPISHRCGLIYRWCQVIKLSMIKMAFASDFNDTIHQFLLELLIRGNVSLARMWKTTEVVNIDKLGADRYLCSRLEWRLIDSSIKVLKRLKIKQDSQHRLTFRLNRDQIRISIENVLIIHFYRTLPISQFANSLHWVESVGMSYCNTACNVCQTEDYFPH